MSGLQLKVIISFNQFIIKFIKIIIKMLIILLSIHLLRFILIQHFLLMMYFYFFKCHISYNINLLLQ